jgi:hypothetical protein
LRTSKHVADFKLSSVKGGYHGIGQRIVPLLCVRQYLNYSGASAAIHEVPVAGADFEMACWVANVKAIVTSV